MTKYVLSNLLSLMFIVLIINIVYEFIDVLPVPVQVCVCVCVCMYG